MREAQTGDGSDPEGTFVNRLIEQIRPLRPLAGWPADATPPAAGELVPLAPPDAADFLEPPAGPGELGRLGSYTVLKVLGAGGMGVVFQARQARPRRQVGLKMILKGPLAGHERLARFRAETELAARLQHPNIVPIYEAGEHQGRPSYPMELLEGGSLARQLAATPLDPIAAARLLEAVARAVEHAHSRGVVHRDLKPSNVLLAADGTPKVADFGLAKSLAADGESSGACRTETGALLGTPAYMAPEQAGGGDGAGPAADVYALGAILYEALTGRPPFRAATVLQTLEQVRTCEPVPPGRLQPGLPRDLQTVCLKCLEKEPGRRYASAREFADDLLRFLAGEPVRARPAGPARRLLTWARRRPALAALVVVTAVSAAAAVAGVLGVLTAARLLNRERTQTLANQERA
ncbi:MAG TPA: serine/threonine-protein kinase, partial [Gemmataceae bacterium]|nr:serine/threonine-protein kinase [Gemmataceae bacterium]